MAKGVRNLTLEVRVGNEPAKELYRRFGFVPAGIRKGYYVETNEDALVMWANDLDRDDMAARRAALAAGVRGATRFEEALR
jgi:ribosomal-protein-alanine N-acetyltransferase